MPPAGPGNGCAATLIIAASFKRTARRSGIWRRPLHAGASTFAEVPDRPASGATILFQAATDACVLPVIAEPPRFGLPSFDLSTVACRIDQIVGADGCRHMVLHDGPSRLRLDLLSGDLLDGPVSIRIRVDRLDWSEWIWTALRR